MRRTYEPGDTAIFTWVASQDPTDLSLSIFDASSTLVSSQTAASSGTGQKYAVTTLPATPGYYNLHWAGTLGGKADIVDALIRVEDITAFDAGSYYAGVADVRDAWPLLAAGDAPRNPLVDRALRRAHRKVDSYLVRNYSLPLDSTPGQIQEIAIDLALFQLARSFGKGTKSDVPKWAREMKQDAIKNLEAIAVGSVPLVSGSGTALTTLSAAVSDFWLNEDGRRPTFTELDAAYQRQDPDYLTDVADDIWS